MLTELIEGRPRDLGGFSVRRVLPAAQRRQLGAFTFLDHMGPAALAAGHGLDVRPHPHIGLSTVTFLYEGEIVHRDSLGVEQPIRPGAVNWMTAGRGIVHSERTSAALRKTGTTVHGLQLWVALPVADEETDPGFHHYASDVLPELDVEGARVRVLAGAAFGQVSPVRTHTPLLFVDVQLRAGGALTVPDSAVERGVYVSEGRVQLGERVLEVGQLAVLAPGSTELLRAEGEARLAVLGGEPLTEPRYLWWNFVSSRPERVEQAAEDWRARRFPLVAGDEVEFTPLPEPGPRFSEHA